MNFSFFIVNNLHNIRVLIPGTTFFEVLKLISLRLCRRKRIISRRNSVKINYTKVLSQSFSYGTPRKERMKNRR